MEDKSPTMPSDEGAAQKLEGFFGGDGELDVTLEPTERPGVYDVHGAVLTKRFVRLSEAFPDHPPIPIDWC